MSREKRRRCERGGENLGGSPFPQKKIIQGVLTIPESEGRSEERKEEKEAQGYGEGEFIF